MMNQPMPGQAPPMNPVGAQGAPANSSQGPYQLTPEQQQAIMLSQAAERQKQMQAVQGQPPTVVQALQQQMQPQPQQMPPQQMPPQQPRPQGIDQVPSNLRMAGGGIVGFDGGGLTQDQLLAQIPTGGSGGGPTPGNGNSVSSTELERNIANLMAAMPGLSITKAVSIARLGAPAVTAFINNDRSISGDRKQAEAAQPPQPGRSMPDTGVGGGRGRVNPPNVVPQGIDALTKPAPQPQTGAQTQGSRSMGGDPTVPQQAETPQGQDEIMKLLMERAKADPAEARRRALEDARANDGSGAYSKEMQEIMAARKAAAPQDATGWQRAMEFMKAGAEYKPQNGANNSLGALFAGAVGANSADQQRLQKKREMEAEMLKMREGMARDNLGVAGSQFKHATGAEADATRGAGSALTAAAGRQGDIERTAMGREKMAQDASQFAQQLAMDGRKLQQALVIADKQGKSEDKRLLAGLAGQSKLLESRAKLLPKDQMLWDETHKQEAAAIAQERALIRQQYAMITGTKSEAADTGDTLSAPPPGAVKKIGG